VGFYLYYFIEQYILIDTQSFTIVLELLFWHFRKGLPWEVFYADGFVLLAEFRELLVEKIKIWKKCLKNKGLKVNISKTKAMKCHVDANMQVESSKYLCGICGKGVGRNSGGVMNAGCIRNGSITNTVGVKGRLKEDPGYRCTK